ncbi:hypothetical protein Tco_0959901 [Tanacetum coccineum]
MAALESYPKHNMIAYLKKTEGNVEFHEVIDFLQRSYIFHALTVSPIVSTTFVEQFWTSATSKTFNNVRHITANVAGKVVSISEASIRTDLLFDDADGMDTLPNQAIFNAIQRMGYEGEFNFPKGPLGIKFHKYCHSCNLFNTNQKVQPTQDEVLRKRLSDEPPYTLSAPHLVKFSINPRKLKLLRLRSQSSKNKLNLSSNIIKISEEVSQCSQGFPRRAFSRNIGYTQILSNKGGRKQKENPDSKRTSVLILSTEDVVSTDKEGVSTDFEKVSTDRPIVSTDESKVSTDEQVEGTEESNESTEEIFESSEEQRDGTEEKLESTARQIKGTEDQTKEEIASQTSTQTPTSMTFGDDETIATLLLNMSKAKAASKEKEKGLNDDIPQAVKKFKQLRVMKNWLKFQNEWQAEEERKRLLKKKQQMKLSVKTFDDINARIDGRQNSC